ncbi:PACE efflux transporter [Aeromonas schubertii]|uniref:Membrane protein n=1 Tax=Aeromonas schubertii TaxID=652 RepID=A0A0S2SL42_9GAMM|nr:membrane protein [Aeromonas schubertii]
MMRNGSDRLRHTLGFELLGVALCAPLASWLLGLELGHTGVMAIGLTLIATVWNYGYNLMVDRWMARHLGRVEKRWHERLLHALGFEGGLLLISLPLIAWWLSLSLWQALLMDLGFALFYLVYAFFYNLAYDKIFPIPQSA